ARRARAFRPAPAPPRRLRASTRAARARRLLRAPTAPCPRPPPPPPPARRRGREPRAPDEGRGAEDGEPDHGKRARREEGTILELRPAPRLLGRPGDEAGGREREVLRLPATKAMGKVRADDEERNAQRDRRQERHGASS